MSETRKLAPISRPEQEQNRGSDTKRISHELTAQMGGHCSEGSRRFLASSAGRGDRLCDVPGRNGLIAFQDQTDAGVQIFTVRPNGRGLQQITHMTGDAVAPDW